MPSFAPRRARAVIVLLSCIAAAYGTSTVLYALVLVIVRASGGISSTRIRILVHISALIMPGGTCTRTGTRA
eukprot:scaffold476428_cov17-Prasinocladus_malaysianus.AAC.1